MLLTICTAALPGVRSDGNAWSDPVAQGPARTRVVTNDNRTPSGTVVNGVLELKLELTQGVWHPQNDNGVGLPVRVIGEDRCRVAGGMRLVEQSGHGVGLRRSV